MGNSDARESLGRVGIWSKAFRTRDTHRSQEYARELESLGYRALWVPGGNGGPFLENMDTILGGTTTLKVAAGILNIWLHDAADTASWMGRHRVEHPGRLLVGLGASHPVVLENTDRRWTRPLAHLEQYVDDLVQHEVAVRPSELMLAALGPKALRLAADRTLGAHTFFVTADHTARARQLMGDEAWLVPEIKVVREEDPVLARRIAREGIALYLGLANYTRNLMTLGFDESDFIDGGSDRLVDATVAWGDDASIAAAVELHLEAGADHVCMQVLHRPDDSPVEAWAALAQALAV